MTNFSEALETVGGNGPASRLVLAIGAEAAARDIISIVLSDNETGDKMAAIASLVKAIDEAGSKASAELSMLENTESPVQVH